MGCHSPASITEGYEWEIHGIIRKVVDGMKKEWHPYTWILYFGWMIWPDKKVNIIEFNARWWDPETQVVLPALEKDYFDLVYNYALSWKLSQFQPVFSQDKRLCVVWTAHPYPNNIEDEKWKKILWLDKCRKQRIKIFGAWMKDIWNNEFGVNGWRLFSAVSRWADFLEIRHNIHNALGSVWINKWKLHFRTDIAEREIKRTK
jgi:phosphoribosylamine--glycine ligase